MSRDRQVQPHTPRGPCLSHLPSFFLSWNDKPKDDDDSPHPGGTHFSTIQKEDDEKNPSVGWPPIETWRKKALLQHPQPPLENRSNQNGGPNSLFVKVKMEGVAIARKLDLRLYHSHNSLKTALIAMFTASNYEAIDNKCWDFTLIYEDEDGDWLLAEDLPWNSFVESVRRLKVLVRKRNKE
ncbi:auxin-responsive protein IAA29-like [Cucurbita maxima]|uniref:Auxin-responsive protein n=1 Tax=Cucurbita maxima TaxID=3661 RepID=A0A6J1K2I8_CUCMA|nr:auxin-responsive protein IAA29-like [Cucurbita maxima]